MIFIQGSWQPERAKAKLRTQDTILVRDSAIAYLSNKNLTESDGFVLILTPLFFKIASMVSNDALFIPSFFRFEFI